MNKIKLYGLPLFSLSECVDSPLSSSSSSSSSSLSRPPLQLFSSLSLIVLMTAYIHPRFSLGKTIPFHLIPRVLYNHILIITKTTTATTKDITTTNVVIITITIRTALTIIIISLPQPLACDNVKST